MRLDRYVKRSSKKLRQELLNTVLKQELEYLRKRCFPYKRRPFLYMPVEIMEDRLDETTGGTYKNNREKNKYNYTHMIKIQKNMLYAVNKMPYAYYRKKYLYKLRDVVRHELSHAFIEERYEHICPDLKGKNRDASPIFLTFLNFIFTSSGHDCARRFEYSKQFNEDFMYFEELDDYLFDLIYGYWNVVKDLKLINNKESFVSKKDKHLITIMNDFEFASRNPGLSIFNKLNSTNIIVGQNKIFKNEGMYRCWQIGCNVAPNDIKRLYERKYYTAKAKYYTVSKTANVVNSKTDIKEIVIREDKNYSIS